MDFLTIRYQNNKTYKNLFSDHEKITNKEYFKPEKTFIPNKEEKIEELEKKINDFKKTIKKEILEEDIDAEPFFDDEFLKHLEILNEFFSSFIPNFPKYYSEGKVNPRAFLDAKDLLENEFPLSPEEILYTPTTDTGVTKADKMNFENGYTVDFDGNVYNPDRRLVYNSNFENEKVKFIDLLNNKVVTDKGIRLELPKNFIDDFLVGFDEIENDVNPKTIKTTNTTNKKIIDPNKFINPKIVKEHVKKIREKGFKYPKNISGLINFENVYASFRGYPITFEEKYLIELPVDNLYLSDIFTDIEKISFIDEIKNFNTTEKELGICNFKDIPFTELTSLILWGGGEKGVKPLSSSILTDKDIVFSPDGTAKYTNVSSTITISRRGCSAKTYETGHVCMWTPQNRLGLRRSIIQYIYGFCASIGLFNANIPRLSGFKKIKIFGGICIGGLLERVLCSWQRKLSKRINEMFQCIPAKLDTDLAKSGFENATYPYGPSLENIEDLNNISSVKFGDRYVVNKVPTNVSGNKILSCGVFFFDPNKKLSNFCPWRYNEVWAGKPFNPKDNFQVIQEFNNVFENPIIQDILSNTNALGEDSITRKLMSLLYAFMKKQLLLTSSDIQNSIETIIENSIYNALENITDNLGKYQELVDSANEYLNVPIEENSSTNTAYIKFKDNFIKYFEPLKKYFDSNGNFIDPDFTNVEGDENKNKNTSSNSSSVFSRAIKKAVKSISKKKQEEFKNTLESVSVLTNNKDLKISPSLISYYDSLLFAFEKTPSAELKEIFWKNLEYLRTVNPKLALDYENIKTIRDYLNVTDKYSEFYDNLKITMEFITYDLNINGYSKEVFEQCLKRINTFIDDVSII